MLSEREKKVLHRLTVDPQPVMALTDSHEREEAAKVRASLMRLRSEGLADRRYEPMLGGYVWWRA